MHIGLALLLTTAITVTSAQRRHLRGRVMSEIEEADISGGIVVNPRNKYPFIVYAGNNCTASLIASNVILTAASCPTNITEVNLGRYDLDEHTNVSDYETYNVLEQVRHPNFNQTTRDFDFMVLLLDAHVQNFSLTELDNATITTANTLTEDDDLVVIGYGGKSKAGKPRSKLLEIEVDYISNRFCNRLLLSSKELKKRKITKRMFCARKTEKSCQGDYGSPVIDKSNGKLVGMASWCGGSNLTGVYSRVRNQLEWINDYVNLWAENNYYATISPSVMPSESPEPSTTPTLSHAPSGSMAPSDQPATSELSSSPSFSTSTIMIPIVTPPPVALPPTNLEVPSSSPSFSTSTIVIPIVTPPPVALPPTNPEVPSSSPSFSTSTIVIPIVTPPPVALPLSNTNAPTSAPSTSNIIIPIVPPPPVILPYRHN